MKVMQSIGVFGVVCFLAACGAGDAEVGEGTPVGGGADASGEASLTTT